MKFPPEYILDFVELVDSRRISSSIAAAGLRRDVRRRRGPGWRSCEQKGWAQVSDAGAIEAFCDQAIAAHPGPVADYKAGKAAALNFLKGQVMKLSKGKANPALAGEILERKLK